ncbi:MAG TPA: sigma-54 dependent transcriptional regulator [Chitinophaga sp.]
MKRILIIDDEPCICLLLSNILRKAGFNADTTLSGVTGLKMIKEQQYDLVFCDYRLKDKEKDGNTLLQVIRDTSPLTAVVIMTGYPDVRIAVRAIKEGAFDYLQKPFTADKILEVTRGALNNYVPQMDIEIPSPPDKSPAAPAAFKAHTQHYVYGESDISKELYDQISLIASTDYSVVIRGETGTGKEAVARLVHLRSDRKKHPFVALDCGCLSDELAASELFGHQKGAFTGAVESVCGAFRQAQGGTLFLDEITNLNYQVQTALLRVVQERVVRPVGSLLSIPVNIRIIAASNESLAEAVASGRFRQDLFYRLNEFCISVPPLRERQQDLPLFITAFLREIEREAGNSSGRFSDEAMACMLHYSWPGNIRELRNVIRRAVLFSEGAREIATTCLPPEIAGASFLPTTEAVAIPPEAVADENNNLKSISRNAEYQKIVATMKTVKYNKTKAARLLNIDRKTLYNKLHSLNIGL